MENHYALTVDNISILINSISHFSIAIEETENVELDKLDLEICQTHTIAKDDFVTKKSYMNAFAFRIYFIS